MSTMRRQAILQYSRHISCHGSYYRLMVAVLIYLIQAGFGAGFGSSTPAFGTPQSTPAFGGSLFGGTPAQTFGSTPGFSFSQASSSAFSFPSSAPAFGQSSSTPQPFGGASTGGFSFGQQVRQHPLLNIICTHSPCLDILSSVLTSSSCNLLWCALGLVLGLFCHLVLSILLRLSETKTLNRLSETKTLELDPSA